MKYESKIYLVGTRDILDCKHIDSIPTIETFQYYRIVYRLARISHPFWISLTHSPFFFNILP